MPSTRITLGLDELRDFESRAECTCCGREEAQPHAIPFAAGAHIRDLNEYLPKISLCRQCRLRLSSSYQSTRVATFFGIIVPPLFLVGLSVLIPFQTVLVPFLAWGVGMAVGVAFFRHARRKAAHSAPLFVVSASGQLITFVVNSPDESDDEEPREGQGPYRSGENDGQEAKGLQRKKLALSAGTGGLVLGTLMSFGASFVLINGSFPNVVFDNPTQETYVVQIDRVRTFQVEPMSQREIRMRYGEHDFFIREEDGVRSGHFEGTVSWGENNILYLEDFLEE